MRTDEWEDGGPFLYRPLPADTLARRAGSQDPAYLYISRWEGLWWLADDRHPGADAFGSLDEAKARGDARVAAAEEAADGSAIRDAGLDAAAWRFAAGEGPELVRDADGAVAGPEAGTWTVRDAAGALLGSGSDARAALGAAGALGA